MEHQTGSRHRDRWFSVSCQLPSLPVGQLAGKQASRLACPKKSPAFAGLFVSESASLLVVWLRRLNLETSLLL
jgi:hypothetical protein